MEKISCQKINEIYLRVTSEQGVEQEISDTFKFEVPGYKFMPSYKAGRFDGFIRLYNLGRKTMYVGLYDNLRQFAERNNYELIEIPSENHKSIQEHQNLDREEVYEWMRNLEHTSKGNPVVMYDHQLEAVYVALNENRVTLLSPTASGKSAIIYSIVRWHLEHERKILLVVPSTQLCEQMYSDFEDYSSESKWNVEDHCQKLYSGYTKDISKNVLISTWQNLHSTIKKNATYLSDAGFDCVIVDEVHLAAAQALNSLLESMTDVKYRIGLTGTLNDAKANKLSICGLLGREFKVISTRELMDQGKVVDLDIRCLVIEHDEEDRKLIKKASYEDELKFIITLPKRNEFIANLAIATKGNTLILVNWIEDHLEPLYDLIKSKARDRKVYIMCGKIKAAEREAIRLQMETETDVIVIGNSHVCSTGINIPSLENIILAAAGKSKIRNLQSIGRGLRLKEGKNKCRLFDIADNLSIKKQENHLFKHFKERVSIYSKEQFEYKIIPVKL